MTRIRITVIIIILMFVASACGPSEADLAATEEIIRSTNQAEGTQTASVLTAEAATQEYLTQVAGTQQAGTSQASTATQASQATATSVLATQQKWTQNAVVAQTQQASAITEIVQALFEKGYLSKTVGSYQRLPRFDESWAQIGWIRSYLLEDSFSTDFVLRVDISWESASRSAEFNRSGCGIAFRMAEDYSEYYAFMLGLDGNMNFYPAVSSSNIVYLSKAYWGAIDHMEGETTVIITAEGGTYQVFNEELKRIDLRNGAELVSGYLAYQIASGINTDFGTYCEFTNTDLWRLE